MPTVHETPGSQLLARLVPPWRDALPPHVSRVYFDGFVARNRDRLIHRLNAMLAQRGDATHAARPRAGAQAVRILDRRLSLMPLSFSLAGRRYHTPYRTIEAEEIVIELQASMRDGEDMPPRLLLHVAPRDTGRLAPLDLRGELQDARGDVVARFDWHSIPRADFMSLSDDALARLLGLDAAPATTDAPPETETEIEAPAEDDAAQAHHDRAHIDRTRLPTRWAAELDLLDRMHEGEPMPDTAIQTRRQLEGRGVLVRRDGGVFEVQHTRPIEWIITPGLDLFARGRYHAAGPAKALGVFGRTLHRLGYPEPDPASGPAFGVGRIHLKSHAELRRLIDTLGRQGVDPTTQIARDWVAAIELNQPIPLPPVPPDIRQLVRALSQAGIPPRTLERHGVARAQWDAHALHPREALPALYQEILDHRPVRAAEVAARLPASLADRHALALEILDDMTTKGLLSPGDRTEAT
jgi:hypothetical protein